MAEKVNVELNVETKQAEKNVDNVTEAIQNLTKLVEEGNKQTAAGFKKLRKLLNQQVKESEESATLLRLQVLGCF
jgi:hypothetical protein